jgi:hypothetical protein
MGSEPTSEDRRRTDMTWTARLLATGALALTATAAGCSSGVEGEAAGDCSLQIRLDGDTYTSYGFTDRDGTRYAPADEASCEDVGEDPRGSVFSDDAPRVTTWTFSGYPPDDVLGVRFDADSFTVYVADSLAPDERDRIFEELAPR